MTEERKYVDELDEEVQTSAGAGGLVSEMSYHGAFNVFCSTPPAERVFLFNNKAEKTGALAKAKVLAEEHGARYEETRCTVQYRDTVLSRDVSGWKGNQYHTYGPIWGDVVRGIVNPKRKELDILAGQKFWGRMGSVEDPWAVANPEHPKATETLPNGTTRIKRVRLPVERFPTRKEAEEAAASSPGAGNGASSANVPSGYTVETWASVKPDIKAQYQKLKSDAVEKLKGTVPDAVVEMKAGLSACTKVAEMYAASEEHVAAVLKE